MEDKILALIYLISIAGSCFYIWLGAKGMRGDYGNDYFDTSLIVALAGFAVFPVMNTVLCLGISIYLVCTSEKRKAAVEMR